MACITHTCACQEAAIRAKVVASRPGGRAMARSQGPMRRAAVVALLCVRRRATPTSSAKRTTQIGRPMPKAGAGPALRPPSRHCGRAGETYLVPMLEAASERPAGRVPSLRRAG